MEHYEIIFMVHPQHSDQVPSIVNKYKSIVRAGKGHVHRFEDWGLRSLAYQIQKMKNAHYVLLNLECNADSLAEIKEDFRFNEALLRNLILRKDEAITGPSPVALELKRSAEKAASRQLEQSTRESKVEGRAKPKAEGRAEPKAEGGAEPKAEVGAKPKAEGGTKPKAEGRAESKAEGRAEPKAEGRAESKAEGGAKPKADLEVAPEKATSPGEDSKAGRAVAAEPLAGSDDSASKSADSETDSHEGGTDTKEGVGE